MPTSRASTIACVATCRCFRRRPSSIRARAGRAISSRWRRRTWRGGRTAGSAWCARRCSARGAMRTWGTCSTTGRARRGCGTASIPPRCGSSRARLRRSDSRGRGSAARGEAGISFGFRRRGNQTPFFPRGRFEADRSRTRVQLGSSAKRPHRKIRGLFPRENPPESERNPRPARPADGGHAGGVENGDGK